MTLEFKIDGIESLMKRLNLLEKKSAGKVMASMIRGGLNVIGKQMKSDVDPKVKLGRKAVKSRFKNDKRRGFITAKVGFGVARKRGKSLTPKAPAAKRKGGVGISAQNIHWWVAGTKQRTTKKLKLNANRGRMPSMQPGLARIAASKAAGKVKAEMIKRGALQLKKEVAKLQGVK